MARIEDLVKARTLAEAREDLWQDFQLGYGDIRGETLAVRVGGHYTEDELEATLAALRDAKRLIARDRADGRPEPGPIVRGVINSIEEAEKDPWPEDDVAFGDDWREYVSGPLGGVFLFEDRDAERADYHVACAYQELKPVDRRILRVHVAGRTV